MATTQTPRPPSPASRLPTLDILRGLAILGTFASNVWIFAGATGAVDASEFSFQSIASWVPNGKFVGLLTIMFGIGIAIQFQAARRSGARWPGSYLVRCALLFVDGLLNFYLVIAFDVLRYYAVAAFVVAFLILFSDRIQWALVALFGAIHVWGMVSVARAAHAMSQEEVGDAARIPSRFEEIPMDRSVPMDTPTWIDTVRANLSNFGAAFDLTGEFKTFMFYVAALFLLGGLLFRRGVLDERGTRLRKILMIIGAVSVPLDFYTGVVSRTVWFDFSRYFFSVGIALGILALVVEFYRWRPRVGFLGSALSHVGRMALSCYLLQNILGVAATYTVLTWSSLADVRQDFVAIALWLAISVILVVFSRVWLSVFDRGPMESVWHVVYTALTRRRRVHTATAAPKE